ncbi:MAG: class I SAM-dependent methyltransferase [Microscillaceae bacterium]|nr:class I SAM-dependent methyltransferase [Microscillaceae bacterium]MDW8459665.1 class I SAM-dependent methyltransferase [Cytophagales bacterium]
MKSNAFLAPQKEKEWFRDWFNSPYYHILYQNRNEQEAELFIRNLIQRLHFQPEYKILDLACGKGRHAIMLNKCGFDVTGLDLAPENIAFAKQYENERLHFAIADMRQVYRENYFDIVLNLFTSFGYFDQEADHLKSLQAIYLMLKANGKLILDFMNVSKVLNTLKAYEIKIINGIHFHIYKKIEQGYIIKDIQFEHQEQEFFFQEKVRLIDYHAFLEYFKAVGFQVLHTWGSYHLDNFHAQTSDRLIWVVQK